MPTDVGMRQCWKWCQDSIQWYEWPGAQTPCSTQTTKIIFIAKIFSLLIIIEFDRYHNHTNYIIITTFTAFARCSGTLKRIHTKNDKTHKIHSHDKTHSFMTRHTAIIIVNIILKVPI